MEKAGIYVMSVSVESWSGKAKGDENFPVGSILIRSDLRPHIHAFYNFARIADDIADHETFEANEKIFRLNVMEDVLIGRSDEGAPSALELRQSLAQSGVSPIHAQELLIAFRQDAIKSRYDDYAELAAYCRYSAAPVGRYVLDLHGEDQASWTASDALCKSLQILNHLQDCQKDLTLLDRCYLPLDRLAAHGTSIEALRASALTPGLRAVLDELLAIVRQLNQRAAMLPGHVKARGLRVECGVIVNLAERLTEHLQVRDPLAQRVKLKTFDVVGSIFSSLRFIP